MQSHFELFGLPAAFALDAERLEMAYREIQSRVHPDRFAHAEAQEQQLRGELGDVAILRERRGGVSRPLTLNELRRRQRDRSTVS